MANIDDRVVRLGIEIDGAINWYEDLAIRATGTKFASVIGNETDIKITNLNKQNRDYLMSAVSPYNLNRTPKNLILEAGRKGKNVYQIFSGSIIRAEITQPPDITISFKAMAGAFQSGLIVSNNMGTNVQLSAIATRVAADMGLSLQFEATDKLVSNYSFSGAANKQIEALNSLGNVNAYQDDDKLVVKDYGVALAGSTLVINENTGMIGMPQLDVQGVTVKFLIDAVPVLGGGLDVQSKFYPAANGTYSIYKLDYDIANREQPFYWIAKGSRPGMGL